MGYDGSLKFNTEILEKGFNTGIKKLGSIAKSGLAVVGGAVTGVAVSFGVMTKKALDSYASLEQNIGGVETLFKNSSQSVIDNAKRAYKTASLSANAYMETVTSFSASLLQSLGGDTKKAADYADRAIIDMSDNANKMGTSMELIQNAYQGFAKQNYTMLDNLKLGYGGTKEEMQRLVQDASKMIDVQKELGLTVDGSSLSFGNIVNAISVMQKHMGIAGTTAKEASETISGSVSAMKGAFDNFLNGTGSPKELAETMVTAGKNVIKGLSEIIPRLLETLPEVKNLIQENLVQAFSGDTVQRMVEAGNQIIVNLLLGIAQGLPNVILTAVQIIQSIIENLDLNRPQILSAGSQILISLINGVMLLTGQLAVLALNIVSTLASGIGSNLPQILQKGKELLDGFCQVIRERLPEILQNGSQMIAELLTGILKEAPTIIQEGTELLEEFVKTILDTLPDILSSGKEMILSLLDGLIMEGPKIISEIGKDLVKFVAEIGAHLPGILQKGIEIIGELLAGIIQKVPDVISAIPGIISDIGSEFLNKDWAGIGWDIIRGIGSGIRSAASGLVDAAVRAAKDAVAAVKGWLGINSPSRLMRDQVGKYMALGMGIGFEKNIPENKIVGSTEKIVRKMQMGVSDITAKAPLRTISAAREVNNYTGASIDYNKIKSAQLEAMNEANERPIILNNRQINRALRDGGIILT